MCVLYTLDMEHSAGKNIKHQNKHTPPIQLCTSEIMLQMFNLAMIGIKTKAFATQQQQKQHNQLPEKNKTKKTPAPTQLEPARSRTSHTIRYGTMVQC